MASGGGDGQDDAGPVWREAGHSDPIEKEDEHVRAVKL